MSRIQFESPQRVGQGELLLQFDNSVDRTEHENLLVQLYLAEVDKGNASLLSSDPSA